MSFVFVISLVGVLAIGCINLMIYRKLVRIKGRFNPRAPRLMPELGVGAKWPDLEIKDQGLQSYNFGDANGKTHIFIISAGCSVCKSLFRFLSANQSLFNESCSMHLATSGDKRQLSELLWPASYSILDTEDFRGVISRDLSPALFIIEKGVVIAAYLVNTPEELISIVAPELL
jgi:hypothetical protein